MVQTLRGATDHRKYVFSPLHIATGLSQANSGMDIADRANIYLGCHSQ